MYINNYKHYPFFHHISSDNSDPKTCWISSPSHSTRILRLVDHHRILEYATCPAAYCAGTKGNSGVLRDATCNMWHLVIYLDAHSSVDVAHPNKVTLHICELFVFFFWNFRTMNLPLAVSNMETTAFMVWLDDPWVCNVLFQIAFWAKHFKDPKAASLCTKYHHKWKRQYWRRNYIRELYIVHILQYKSITHLEKRALWTS